MNHSKINKVVFSFLIITGLYLGTVSIATAQKAAQIFSDNMVLQRDIEVPIWGKADPGEMVTVTFDGKTVNTTTSRYGDWLVKLPQHSAGGPFILKIEGKSKTIFNNIMVGDVWIAGGQSNMQFSTNSVFNSEEELKNADFPEIRLLSIYTDISEIPQETYKGTKWEVCTPQSARWFSAIGFLFARNIYTQYQIPVGIISSNCGGTNVETWTSMEAMMAFDNYQSRIEEIHKIDLRKAIEEHSKEQEKWKKSILNDDPGDLAKYYNPETDYSTWKEMTLPGNWEYKGYPNLDGSVWFMKSFELSKADLKKGITLHLSKIDDEDYTYVNGMLTGSTLFKYDELREYPVKPELLKEGTNIIVVKTVDYGGGGGIWGDAEDMYVESVSKKINLSGNWKYKIGIDTPMPKIIGANDYPGLLYNAMIAPVVGYGIKGVIWYQGEANIFNAPEYIDHFPALIADWRKQWHQGDFPFLYVQLANYNAKGTWDDGDWVTIRDTQTKVLSKVKNTGMAVTIDIGNSHNIHPNNKQDVAKRLFLAARHIAYGEELIYSGPIYQSMTIKNDKIYINFNYVGNGLKIKGKEVTGIEIAGEDQQFVPAKSKIKDQQLIVWSPRVLKPVTVRYGWAQDPQCNLYNSENLPASPFKTEN